MLSSECRSNLPASGVNIKHSTCLSLRQNVTTMMYIMTTLRELRPVKVYTMMYLFSVIFLHYKGPSSFIFPLAVTLTPDPTKSPTAVVLYTLHSKLLSSPFSSVIFQKRQHFMSYLYYLYYVLFPATLNKNQTRSRGLKLDNAYGKEEFHCSLF